VLAHSSASAAGSANERADGPDIPGVPASVCPRIRLQPRPRAARLERDDGARIRHTAPALPRAYAHRQTRVGGSGSSVPVRELEPGTAPEPRNLEPKRPRTPSTS